MNLFKLILNKLKNIHPKIESEINYKLNNLIEEFKYSLINPSIDEISLAILEELDIIEEFISNVKKDFQKEEIKYKNQINIKYFKEGEDKDIRIFGEKFVNNNINNIYLIINGENSPLVEKCDLKDGENNVTICIENTLTNLSDMFKYCQIFIILMN